MRRRPNRQVRVLMLGWEYPPRFAGGLGKACQGLSQAMAKQNAQVFFVLPTFPERLSEPKLEVVGARECLIEAGWNPDLMPHSFAASSGAPVVSTGSAGSGASAASSGGMVVLPTEAKLFPYGAAPTDKISEMGAVHRLIHGGDIGGAPTFRRIPKLNLRSVSSAPAAEGSGATQSPPPQAQAIPAAKEIYGKNLWSEIERYCFTVRHMAEAHEVDCVHAHDWMTFPAAFEFQRVTGAPVFLHVHATEYDRSGENLNHDIFRIEREGFRRATHIFAVSRYTAGIIQRLYGVHRRKISVVYNAPEEGATSPLASPDLPREPQVVFLGRLTFQKGPDHFLRAAALVAQAYPEARFVFCGTGDMMDKLRAQSHRLGVEGRVHFAGFVDPAGVDEVLKHSRVLVMPSVSEPFGLVALEAIRCGIPVIISKQSGVREVLSRALQVDFWDHEKLADQILAALRLRDLSRQLVNEGLEQLQQLSWEKSARSVIEHYHNYLGSTYAQVIGGAHGH